MERTVLNAPAFISPVEKPLLADRLASVLEFAKNSIQHLIIDGHAAPEDAPWFVRQEKIIAETAFLMVFAQAGKAYIQVAENLAALAEVLKPLARSEAMLLNICLKPALALDYAHAHLCLNYSGYPDKKFDAALTEALQSQAAKGIERTPYRNMEREWLRRIWDKSHPKTELQFWIPRSTLNHPVDLFSESSDGVYALTHAIMYAAFDRQEIPGVNTDQLIQMVEALLVRYMDEQDYDISGELLMAWPLLGKPMSPIALFALDCLISIEKRVGFLPAPGLDLSMIEGKERQERRTYIYSINYHTVLVMGLVCSTMLENKGKPFVQESENVFSTALKNKLAKELHQGKEVHWKDFFNKLEEEQKMSLLPWVFQALLARYIKNRKYKQAKELLDLSKGSELETLPMSCQAKELLQRLGRHAAQ